ncbi:hypothetical protein BDD12DRAFT_744486 [Trichophaea hybrida]|nr:hypothetical protein BDD12DRAFT_744486 [Trichophaea hybrida]
MSKKRAPARSGGVSPATFGAPAISGGFASSTTSVLSFIGEPPDLSPISDSSVVVLFKGLSKKEEITKAKALEGLIAAVGAVESTEDAVLTAWVRLYPQLSIDVSARVRRLANSLQGEIGAKSGKRLARHMPKIVGPWLCGLFDSDRTSARETRESLLKVFKSEEKLNSIWKAYQNAILDFCKITVITESVYSLSDERWVVPDDAEAKFARVIATCYLAVAHLISTQELEPLDESYGELLREKILWTFAFHADSFLRRAVYKLLQDALEKRPQWISSNLEMVSTALIMKASAKFEVPSVNSYLEALVALTKQFPEAWTLAKPSKKKIALVQFVSFVEKGSQMGLPSYWDQVSSVLSLMPKEIFAEKEERAKNVLNGILKGIKVGPEPRTHMMAAWGCYWDACYRFLELQLAWPDFDNFILQQSILPVYEGYVTGAKPKEYIISQDDAVAATVCGNGLVKLDRLGIEMSTKVLNGVWKKVEESVVNIAKAERANTTENGALLRRCGEAWTKLVVGVLKQLPKNGVVYEAVVKSNVAILAELIESLLATSGKAVGTAIFLEDLLAKVGTELLQDKRSLEITWSFFLDKFPSILKPETVEHLLKAFVSYGAYTNDATAFQEAWKKTIHALMMSNLPKEKKENSIVLLLNSASSSLADKVSPVPELDTYIVNKMRSALPEAGSSNAWVLVKDALNTTSNIVSQDTTSKMLAELLETMNLDDSSASSRLSKVLNTIAGANPHRLLPFINSSHGNDLVSKLLILANSPDKETQNSAARLRDIITAAVSKTSGEDVERLTEVTIDNIRASVQEPTSEHLSSLVKEAPEENVAALTEKLLFSEDQWESAISPFLRAVNNLSLAITNPLGGCIFLVENDTSSEVITPRDDEGCSAVLRMAMFSMKFLKALEKPKPIIPNDALITLLQYIPLIKEIAKDNLGVAGANDLWTDHSPEMESEMLEFISSVSQWVLSTLSIDKGRQGFAQALVDILSSQCGDASAKAFYVARALAAVMSDLCENNQFFRDKAAAWADGNDIWKTKDIFRSAGMLAGSADILTHSKKERLWSGLIGSLLGVSSAKTATEGLQQLILLNAALPSADERASSIPHPRAMNLIRHLLSWLDEENEEIELSPGLVTEISKVLCNILPIGGGIYGSHWQSIFDFVKSCWEGCASLDEVHLPMVFSTLKLFQVLRSLIGRNDDLDEAWAETKKELYARLINLLLKSGRPDNMHQPRNIVNTQIAKQLRNIDVTLVEDPGAIYLLLGIQSRPIQKAAFNILHRYIPTAQEQISVDVALSSDATNNLRLPPEILSMIIEAPELPDGLDLEFANEMPIPVKAYLLSWILVFDHFENASFKVKSIYMETLKEGGYLPLLLNFISAILFPNNHVFDASKVDIRTYTPDVTENPLQDLRWLLTHVYYLSLCHTPSLVKSWLLDSGNNRATVSAVKMFTKKHMSPLLIDSELSAVTEWAQTRDEEEEDGMKVKVSKAAREVTASYPVDDQAMDILVRLPEIFPLGMVEVEGLRRVGLNEKKFNQMQLASQAVVNFQSGSTIDALTLFRKNVSLHFQGVSECAICYSILAVTPDRSLPKKACSTCKNKFHSTCLLKWFKTSNSSSCPLCKFFHIVISHSGWC